MRYKLILGVVVLLAALIFALLQTHYSGCVLSNTMYGCPYCGAKAERTRILLIPLPLSVKEGSLTSYWRKNVDSSHKHTWIARATGSPGMVADHPGAFLLRWLVEDKMAIAAMSCLRTKKERIEFMDALWLPDYHYVSEKQKYKVVERCFGIRNAYLENPDRRDWPKILTSLGLPH